LCFEQQLTALVFSIMMYSILYMIASLLFDKEQTSKRSNRNL